MDKPPAGLPRRLAALTYDCVLLIGPIAIYGFVVVLLRGGVAVEPNTPWFTAGLLCIPALFFCWFWTHGGQTLGMVAWRIQVVTRAGTSVSFRRAVLRYCAALISAAPVGLGFLWALWDPAAATWHDRLSGTRVVHIGAHGAHGARGTRGGQTSAGARSRNSGDEDETGRRRPGDP